MNEHVHPLGSDHLSAFSLAANEFVMLNYDTLVGNLKGTVCMVTSGHFLCHIYHLAILARGVAFGLLNGNKAILHKNVCHSCLSE